MSRLRQFLLPAVAAIGMSVTLAAAQGTQGTTFSSANEGVDRFVAAVRANDVATLDKILGTDDDWIGSNGILKRYSDAAKGCVGRSVSAGLLQP